MGNPVEKAALIVFLRDTHRICWLEIYLKLLASSSEPFMCVECNNYFTITQAGNCYYHPEPSTKDLVLGKRKHPCCGFEYDFFDFYMHMPNPKGCRPRMHKIRQKDNDLYNTMIPKKFTIIRDDIPGLLAAFPELVLPNESAFEEPLSLNAEISISEFTPATHLLKPAPKP